MPTTTVQIFPHRSSDASDTSLRDRRLKKSVAKALAAALRFDESVLIVAAATAASSSPETPGGRPNPMKYGKMASPLSVSGRKPGREATNVNSATPTRKNTMLLTNDKTPFK